ncbi:MAG TPA: signal peptidase I [Fimbriimonadaceae bacterium]|nr:signal peptidase I [Fimbriimonadaceae bacterium]
MGSTAKVVIGLVSILAAGYFVQPYRPVIVKGQSMEPTFEDGQLVFAVKEHRKPKVGDVVLVEKDGALLIKRVSMVGGDHYEETYVPYAHRWAILESPAVRRMVKRGVVPCRVRTIPDGQMFITGDNPDVSLDSRMFGLVPESAIRGFVLVGS